MQQAADWASMFKQGQGKFRLIGITYTKGGQQCTLFLHFADALGCAVEDALWTNTLLLILECECTQQVWCRLDKCTGQDML